MLLVEKLLNGSLLVDLVTVPNPSLVELGGKFSKGTLVAFLLLSLFSVIIVNSLFIL